MNANYYEYHGQLYTLAQLEAMYGIPREAIRNRINNGWEIEAAVETPKERIQISIDPKWAGKILSIRFLCPVPKVKASMQPALNKPYIAYPHCGGDPGKKARPFYTITLENQKLLIVYPEEFEILGEAS